jgi:hypothetical protein
MVHQSQIDQAGMAPRPPADDAVMSPQGQVDRETQPAVDQGFAVDQWFAGVQRAQFGIVDLGRAPAEPDLVQAHAGADQHREGQRADFGV